MVLPPEVAVCVLPEKRTPSVRLTVGLPSGAAGGVARAAVGGGGGLGAGQDVVIAAAGQAADVAAAGLLVLQGVARAEAEVAVGEGVLAGVDGGDVVRRRRLQGLALRPHRDAAG